LSEYFLSRWARQNRIANPGITEKAIQRLTRHPWPGNVRELANTIQKALIFNRGTTIDGDDISAAIEGEKQPKHLASKKQEDLMRRLIKNHLHESSQRNMFEMLMNRHAGLIISEALLVTNGNRSQAAKLLGLSRPTLHAKIEKYKLKFKTSLAEY
jgi:DNA-binding NtrC family response regulator